MYFHYLGPITSSSRDILGEVQTQLNIACVISGCIRDVICNKKHMPIENKVCIYNTSLRPVFTDAAEIRAETSKTKQILRAMEMRTRSYTPGQTRKQ